MTPLPVSVRIAWVIAGAGFVFSFLAILSIGIFILPIAVLACVYAAVRSQGRGLRLLLTGAGLPVLWIAWLNRHGPGDYCITTAHSMSCEEMWNPWPWLACGVAPIVVGSVPRPASRGRRQGAERATRRSR